MSIYDDGARTREDGKCYRIEGRIESGNVDHARRLRPFLGSRYRCGKARDHQWTAGRPYPMGRSMGTR